MRKHTIRPPQDGVLRIVVSMNRLASATALGAQLGLKPLTERD
jgi:hypothetical protein